MPEFPWKRPLSASQIRVLKELAKGPRYTSRTTHHEVVHGGACKSLVKRGLVEVEARTVMGIVYRLTGPGKLALKLVEHMEESNFAAWCRSRKTCRYCGQKFIGPNCSCEEAG